MKINLWLKEEGNKEILVITLRESKFIALNVTAINNGK